MKIKVCILIYYKKTTTTEEGFTVASLIFSYLPLQCDDFFCHSQEKLFAFEPGACFDFAYGALGITNFLGVGLSIQYIYKQ